jgi:hypothetical protein
MRPAYFGTSDQSQSQIMVEAASHDFAVVPFRFPSAKALMWNGWLSATNVGLVIHVPCCYMNPSWIGDFFDEWKKIADAGGWLRDDAGKTVMRCGTTLLDLRLTRADHNPCVDFADALAAALAGLYRKVKFAGVFVDCVWDTISWTADEGAVWHDRPKLDKEWKAGTDLMLKIVKAAMHRLEGKPFIVGNGYTTCPDIDCRCIEGFPGVGWVKNVLGTYGAAKHAELYPDHYAWFIPHSQTNRAGEGASDDDALATISMSAAYYDQGEQAARLDGDGVVLGMNSMQDAKRLTLG